MEYKDGSFNTSTGTLFFLYKNIVYKNIEDEIGQNFENI